MPDDFLAERRKDEEHYFYKKDREAIEKLKAKAEAHRQETERKNRKAAHWMKCPKCGHDLEETKLGALLVDKCKDCGGIFFDAGELDLLLAAENKGSLLKRLFSR